MKLTKLKPSVKWTDQTKEIFLLNINSPEAEKQIAELEKIVEAPVDNIDIATEILKNLYTYSLRIKGGKKPSHRKVKPKKWYDKSCSELSKHLKLTGYLLSKSPNDPYLRGSLIKIRKEYKKLLKLKKREHQIHLIGKLEAIEKNKPKEYWNLLKKLRDDNQDNKICNSETFTTFFEELFSQENELPDQHQEVEEAVLKALEKAKSIGDFSMEEFTKALKILKTNKAPGPDRIPGEAIKSSPLRVQNIILKIVNKIKNSTEYPENWAEGITSLILKDGDEEDPNNYRAITIVNALAKIMAIMINERLFTLFEKEKTIKREQIGFEKKCRPADHLFVLKSQ